MTDPRYIPRNHHQALARLVEECGEVLQAAGKSLRWGFDSYNPDLPVDKRETNEEWLNREANDLVETLRLFYEFMGWRWPL